MSTLHGATVRDTACGNRRGRITAYNATTLDVTVLWANGSYNTLRPADIRSGRYTVEVSK